MEIGKKAGIRVPIILILATVFAFFWNMLFVESMPDWKDASKKQAVFDHGNNRIDISLDDARSVFFSGKAVFIDARSKESYRQGHIAGALNVPWDSVEESVAEILENIDPKEMIITYCDGFTCTISQKLANFLIQLGYSNVKVLINGWSEWVNAGLPTETG